MTPPTPMERHSAAYDPLGTCAGGTTARPSTPFYSATPLAEPGPGAVHIFGWCRDHLRRVSLRPALFWAGEVLAVLSLFVALFGGLIIGEVFR
jgi:hypothetical protein